MAGRNPDTSTYNQRDVARDSLDSTAKLPSDRQGVEAVRYSTRQHSPSSQTVQDLVRNAELPQSLPSVVHDTKSDVANAISYLLPERSISTLEVSAATAARKTLIEAIAGSHPQGLVVVPQGAAKASLPKVPKMSAKFDAALSRTALASKAASATRGGKLFGGLAKGLGRLVGRLAAPLFFAADVVSETDRARGLAKASGGLVASSVGFLGGSALGTGIGTLLMPGVGTAVGYYAGGAIGAAVAYGYGQVFGTDVYDSLNERNPEVVSSMKSSFSKLLSSGNQTLDTSVGAVKRYAPPVAEKASDIMERAFDAISSRLSSARATAKVERQEL